MNESVRQEANFVDCRNSPPASVLPNSLILYSQVSQRASEALNQSLLTIQSRGIRLINLDNPDCGRAFHLSPDGDLIAQLLQELDLSDASPCAIFIDEEGIVIERIIGDEFNDPLLILLHRFRPTENFRSFRDTPQEVLSF